MVTIPNLQSPSANFSITLDGVSVEMSLRYQHSDNSWWLSVGKSGTVLATARVVKGFPLFSANRSRLPLFGDIVCSPTSSEASLSDNVGWEELYDGEYALNYLSDSELEASL
jgi:hypothetical protein